MPNEKDKSTTKAEKLNKVWTDYENARNYLIKLGITEDIPEFVDFVQGKQWPEATAKTENMPRPTFNMTEMIVDTKVSNVVGSPIKLNFIAEDDNVASRRFTQFANYQIKEMGMDELNDRAASDGGIKGTYVYHGYWDEKYQGKRGNYEGGWRTEIIDPLNILFANPSETNEQKQKWIILVFRSDVDSVKEMADDGVNKDLIVSDTSESFYEEEEQGGTDICTLLLRYFRKDGEVYFERATKGVIVNKAKPLNYNLVSKEDIDKKLGKETTEEDTANISQPDSTLEEKKDIDGFKATLYPIAVGSWKKNDKCIYGRGEVVGLIPNQKAINFEVAMQLLNHQELGWGKLLVKANALQGQEPTNAPGEVITDNTPGQAWGIARLDGTGFSAGALNFAPQIMEMTQSTTQTSKIITGDMVSKDLSGTAIGLLQAQGKKSYGRLQKNFYATYAKYGKVLEQAYKLYYEDKEYLYELTPEEQQKFNTTAAYAKDTFNGEDYQNTRFEVVVEAGAGAEYSEVQSLTILNSLLQNKMIGLKDFAKLCPATILPFRNELIEIEDAKEQSQVVQLSQIVQKQADQLKQSEAIIKQMDQEVKKTTNITKGLSTEYSAKLNALNAYVAKLEKQLINSKDNLSTEQPEKGSVIASDNKGK